MKYEIELSDYGHENLQYTTLEIESISKLQTIRENESMELRVFVNDGIAKVFKNVSSDFEFTITKVLR